MSRIKDDETRRCRKKGRGTKDERRANESRPTYEFDGRAVSVDVDEGPQWLSDDDAPKKQALVLSVYGVHHAPVATHVKAQYVPLQGKPFGQSLGPVAVLVGKVGAGVPGQTGSIDGRGVVRREAEPQHPAPTRGDLGKPQDDLLPDGNGSVAEADSIAECLESLGSPLVRGKLDVGAVRLVEEKGPSFDRLYRLALIPVACCREISNMWFKVRWFKCGFAIVIT